MSAKERILFIINPISGQGLAEKLPDQIRLLLDTSRYECEIKITQYAGHGTQLAREAIEEKYTTIVAVGGDGTINEIALELIDTTMKLGIIPMGSGNGLARHAGIPLKPKEAIQLLNKGKEVNIDVCQLNGKTFLNVAGIGFDGYISKLFNERSTRGFLSYIKCIAIGYRTFKPIECSFMINDKSKKGKYFTIAWANSQQYGNNTFIAPKASLTDGLLDIVMIRPFPVFYIPAMITRFMTKTLHRSKYVEIFQTDQFSLDTSEASLHLDGNFEGNVTHAEVLIKKKCLRLIVSDKDL